MEICKNGHDEIIHNETWCPLCKANKEYSKLEEENQELEKIVEELQKTIEEMEKK